MSDGARAGGAGALGATLRARRRALGLTQAAVAEAAGIRKSYLSMIENARVENPPSAKVLDGLEAALDVERGSLRAAGAWASTPAAVRERVDALADEAARGRALADWLRENTSRRAGGGRNLDKLFRSGALRRRLSEVLDVAGDGPTVVEAPPRTVPLINRVPAGRPTGFTDLDYPARVADRYVPAFGVDDPDAFAAEVRGSSMEPAYREGEVIIFSPAADVTDGCDAFARLLPHHECTFKRVRLLAGGRITLEPLNPTYTARTYAREQVDGLYRAVSRYAAL